MYLYIFILSSSVDSFLDPVIFCPFFCKAWLKSIYLNCYQLSHTNILDFVNSLLIRIDQQSMNKNLRFLRSPYIFRLSILRCMILPGTARAGLGRTRSLSTTIHTAPPSLVAVSQRGIFKHISFSVRPFFKTSHSQFSHIFKRYKNNRFKNMFKKYNRYNKNLRF